MEQQLDFFEPISLEPAEYALEQQKQIYELTQLVDKQNKLIEDLVQVVETHKKDLLVLINDKHFNQTKFTKLESDINRLDQEHWVADQYGVKSKRIDQAVNEMYPAFQALKNANIADTVHAMIDIFKLHLEQLTETQKAEILSKMASNPTYRSVFVPGFFADNQRILNSAAQLLKQPESILTLYK